MPLTLVSRGTARRQGYNFSLREPLSSTSPNQPVHLTPEAGAFFAFAIPEQNFAFAKLSLASGAGDRVVHGGFAAVNRGADYVEHLAPTLRAGTRCST